MTPTSSWVIAANQAGVLAQAEGLAEAAGLSHERRLLVPRWPWRWVTARAWPWPLRAIPGGVLAPPLPPVLIGSGRMAGPILATLNAPAGASRPRLVMVQHPQMDPRRFDCVVVNAHDGLTGPNVLVSRTALHRVTDARLAAAAAAWAPRFAALPRPLVAVLVGGGNLRFRLDAAVATQLAAKLIRLMTQDHAGLVMTPSRRTAPGVLRVLRAALEPRGAWIWDGTGDNPYFGMLALADAIVVTQDSVSMLSEAVATTAPVLMADLPGRSRRQGQFTEALLRGGRVRYFAGRLEHWPVVPINDTPAIGAELRRRLDACR